jgi:hypothetical protein
MPNLPSKQWGIYKIAMLVYYSPGAFLRIAGEHNMQSEHLRRSMNITKGSGEHRVPPKNGVKMNSWTGYSNSV